MSEDQKKLLSSEIEKQTVFRGQAYLNITYSNGSRGPLKIMSFSAKILRKKIQQTNNSQTKKYQLSGLIDFILPELMYFAMT